MSTPYEADPTPVSVSRSRDELDELDVGWGLIIIALVVAGALAFVFMLLQSSDTPRDVPDIRTQLGSSETGTLLVLKNGAIRHVTGVKDDLLEVKQCTSVVGAVIFGLEPTFEFVTRVVHPAADGYTALKQKYVVDCVFQQF